MHKSSVPKSKVKVPWLCSRSQPGIKVIIRDLRGHLLHTVTFLVCNLALQDGCHMPLLRVALNMKMTISQ